MTFCRKCGNTGKIKGMGGMREDCDHDELKSEIASKVKVVVKRSRKPKVVVDEIKEEG